MTTNLSLSDAVNAFKRQALNRKINVTGLQNLTQTLYAWGMSLLEFDSTSRRNQKRFTFKLVFTLPLILISIALGSTFAANINLNGSQPVEFGQGVLRATACDQSIVVTPFSSFINGSNNASAFTFLATSNGLSNGRYLTSQDYSDTATSMIRIGDGITGSGIPENTFVTRVFGDLIFLSRSYSGAIAGTITVKRPPGRFLLSDITLDKVDSRQGFCKGKNFVISVFGSESDQPLVTYPLHDSGTEFSSGSASSESNFDDPENSSVKLTIIEPSVEAKFITSITIESRDAGQLEANQIGFTPGFIFNQDGCQGPNDYCVIPETQSENSPPFVCNPSECHFLYASGLELLEVIHAIECSGNPFCSISRNSFINPSIDFSTNPDNPQERSARLTVDWGIAGLLLRMDGQVRFSNSSYTVFRWQVSGNPATYVDLVISKNGPLNLDPFIFEGSPSTIPLPIGDTSLPIYEMSFTPSS